jgi:hypothetical protein
MGARALGAELDPPSKPTARPSACLRTRSRACSCRAAGPRAERGSGRTEVERSLGKDLYRCRWRRVRARRWAESWSLAAARARKRERRPSGPPRAGRAPSRWGLGGDRAELKWEQGQQPLPGRRQRVDQRVFRCDVGLFVRWASATEGDIMELEGAKVRPLALAYGRWSGAFRR